MSNYDMTADVERGMQDIDLDGDEGLSEDGDGDDLRDFVYAARTGLPGWR